MKDTALAASLTRRVKQSKQTQISKSRNPEIPKSVLGSSAARVYHSAKEQGVHH